MNNRLLIPVDFSAHALRKNKEITHYLFLLLKCKLSNCGYLTHTDINFLCKYLNRTERTIRKHLDKLVKWNFVGCNSKTGLYYIRSWKRVGKITQSTFITGVNIDVLTIKDPQAFFAGVVIGRLVQAKERKVKQYGKEPAQLMRCETRAYPGSTSNYFIPLADRALAAILNVSKTKARMLKQKAFKYGYILLRKNRSPFMQNGKQVQILQKDKAMLRESYSEYAKHLRVDMRGRVTLQEADIVASKLHYKKGRNY